MTRALQIFVRAGITFCLVGLVAWMIFSSFNAAQEASTRDHQNSALINQNRTLIAEVQADSVNAAIDREKAARNQLLLLNYTAQLAARQDALLAYLRKHGIKIPTRYVTVLSPPVLEVIGGSSKSASKHGKGKK